MRCFIVCCLVALAVCQSITYAIDLEPNKIYEYFYEGKVKVGAPSQELPASELKITSRVKITGDTAPNFFVQFLDVKLEELNGLHEKDQYEPMTSVMNRIAGELAKPFAFHYEKGHVSHITAPPGVSTLVKNLIKGPLDLLHATIKSDRESYELEELSIYGSCKSLYIVRKDRETGVTTLRRDIELQSCRERAAITTGMALAVPNALSKLMGSSVETSVHYEFELDAARSDSIIRTASAVETMQGTPFSLKSGHLSATAQKTLTLVKVTEKYNDIVCDDMEYAGELMYKFEDINLNIPVVMQELDQPLVKAQILLEKLAEQVNKTHIAEEANLNYLRLYECFRAMNASDLDLLWERNKLNPTIRTLILRTIPESVDFKMINFVIKRLKAVDANPVEASQLVIIALSHVSVTPEIIDRAKELLNMSCSLNSNILYKSAVLSYGTLIRKYSMVEKRCSLLEIQPLLRLAEELLHPATFSEEKMLAVLKALGNAGCPLALKLLRRLFFQPVPGRLVTPRMLFSALQSVRLMADIDAAAVQAFTLDVFVTERFSTELRMLAAKQLLETRPPRDILNLVVATLLSTQDEVLGIFTYSYLKSFAKSKTPDNLVYSTEATIAVSTLSSKYEHISSKYNRAIRVDWFEDGLLLGQAASHFLLNSMKDNYPQHVIVSVTSMAIGRILPLAEWGLNLHDLSDILQTVEPDTLASIMNTLNSSPNKNFTLSFYCHIFGQELFFVDVTRETIDRIKEAILGVLKNGGQMNSLMPFLVFEARHVQANCLGLQMEFSKYYSSLTHVDVTIDHPISPLTVNRTIISGSRGSLGMVKQFWTFFGINTNLFQCAAELKTKTSILLPWDFRLRLDIDERKYSLEFPVPIIPYDIFKLSSIMHASIRAVGSQEKNIEIFPSVENDEQNEFKCHPVFPAISWCWMSLLSGTEGVFTGLASAIMAPKVMIVRIVPGAVKVIEKVRISLDLEPDRTQSTEAGADVLLLDHEQKNRASNCTAIPTFIFEVAGMKGNEKIKGWRLNGYKWEGRPEYETSYILSFIGSQNKTMVCVDTRIPNITNAEIHARFGILCKPYKISLVTTTRPAPGFLTTYIASLLWGELPEKIIEFGKRIQPLIPGYMYQKGFSREEATNPAQQIAAILIPSVTHERTLEVQFPTATYRKEGIIVWLRGLIGEDSYNLLGKSPENYI